MDSEFLRDPTEPVRRGAGALGRASTSSA